MNILDISIGDQIEIELSDDGQPRWDWFGSSLTDTGGSGNYKTGRVILINKSQCCVSIDFGDFVYTIPFYGNGLYTSGQWDCDGFAKPVGAADGDSLLKTCTCGAWKTYGKDNSFHSSWCDIK